MEGVKLLLAVLCLAAVAEGYETKDATEDDVMHVRYTTSVAQPKMRYWYRYKKGETITFPPNETAVLFEQNEWGHVRRIAAPRHMVIPDPSTFDLYIAGIQLTDVGNYVAGAKDSDGVISYAIAGLITVYVQPAEPEIHTFPVDLIDLSEGQNFTVTCTTPRLYPAITNIRFVLMYSGKEICPGTSGCEFKSDTIEGDLAMKYTLKFTKILTRTDKYGTLTCGIIPEVADTKTSKTLFMNMKSDGVKPLGNDEL